MRLLHALAGAPALSVLLAASVTAWGGRGPAVDTEAVMVGMDVSHARSSLMRSAPVGTPVDVAFSRLRERGLSCSISEPPLANLTWRVIECSTIPSPVGATLQIDVAGRNGIVADIGAEDPSCMSRADSNDPNPGIVDCDISSTRLLALEARRRAKSTAYLTDALNSFSVASKREQITAERKPPRDPVRGLPNQELLSSSKLRSPTSVKERLPLRSNDKHIR